MKSFKQYLNEARDDKFDRYMKDIAPYTKKDNKKKDTKDDKKNDSKKDPKAKNEQLKEAKIDREYSHSTEIRFDAIGSGFHCDIDPFRSDWDDFAKTHRFTIGVFSSGSVEYSRKATENEIEQHQKALDKEIDPKKGPYWLITQEMKKVMNTEILKAVSEFDKKVETILKKHGFEKKSK